MNVKDNAMPGVETKVRKTLKNLLTNPDFLERVPTTEHGAGAVGTAMAPKTLRGTMNNTIVTEIHVDLTGLYITGTTTKTAIGLEAGGAAYIGEYDVAKYGVVYRIEIICLETPAGGDTCTADLSLGAEDVGTNEVGGAVDDTVLNTAGAAVGCTYITNTPGLTADDYFYITEGADAAADTGTYTAGQLLFRFYGHAVLA